MKPDSYRNGSNGGSPVEDDSEGEENGIQEELSLYDPAGPARSLAALNALRKSRQHYDVCLVADGVEVAAHTAILAAASPYLLEQLSLPTTCNGTTAPAYKVEGVDAEALMSLVEFAYTGKLIVKDTVSARKLYRAAWRLRIESARVHLAERLLRRAAPSDCLELRGLPDLSQQKIAQIDAFISENFEEVCSSGALATLPLIKIEMLQETSARDGEETPNCVADAALQWLTHHSNTTHTLEELSSRSHLLYVDGTGSLRDCTELPAARDDSTDLKMYRAEAQQREVKRQVSANNKAGMAPRALPGLELGARTALARADCRVVASRRLGTRATRALVYLRGALAVCHVSWRDAGCAVGMGGPLGGGGEAAGDARADMHVPRCALGAAVLDARILVCGGYDRTRVLRDAESYDPTRNVWTQLTDMRSARARFPAASHDGRLYALGGSDGHLDLNTIDVYEEKDGVGFWKSRAKLPVACSHAAAVAHEEKSEIYLIGGWTSGRSLKQVHKYHTVDDTWTEAPSLNTGRSQCAGVLWDGSLWVLGGCDSWHCLASTETLPLGEPDTQWSEGPALPTGRRSMGAAVYSGALVCVGGSDGAASLRRVEVLGGAGVQRGAWRAGPVLRHPRAAPGLAVLHDVLYAVGGYTGAEFLQSMECLYSLDGEWTALCDAPAPKPALCPVERKEEVADKEKFREQTENGEVTSVQ